MDLTPIAHAFHTTNPPTPPATAPPPPPLRTVVPPAYMECLKNHAASIGGHALDGCGEFMPSPASTPSDPLSLKCAACGCHRNFHRRRPIEYSNTPAFLQAPLASHRGRSTSTSPSPSPSPISSPSPPPLSHWPPSSSYHQSSAMVAPHMLLALGTGYSGASNEPRRGFNSAAAMKGVRENPRGKKRCRTKFSQEQKEKMCLFSEKLGWKMQKGEDGLVQEFCDEIGVSRGVFKVWMHNNKNTFRLKRSDIGNDVSETQRVNNIIGDDHNSGNNGGFDNDINKSPFVDNVDIHTSDKEVGCVDLHAPSVNVSSS